MIKHQIDDYAGDGNIQPHRKGPARDGAMAQEVATQRSTQRDDDEWHNNHSQNRVRRQYREIDWARDSLPGEARRAVMSVIDDVGNKKQNRSRQRRKLTTLVRQHSSTANEKVPGRQQNETRSIERRVEVRENGIEIGKQKAKSRKRNAGGRRQEAGGRKHD